MDKTILEVKNLKKYFKVPNGYLHAVDNVSFRIGEGKTLGIVGESGCGKSTLGRVILRLHEPTSGKVLFDGMNVTSFNKKEMHQMRSQMQIIFQDPYSSLNPRYTVLGLLAGCGNVQTREPDPVVPAPTPAPGSSSNTPEPVKRDPVPLTLLTTSADEKTANVIRDQLKKAGFDVTVNVYPDSGTFNAAIETEQYDLKIGSHSGAGSPDANVRGPLHSTGTWNVTGLNDAEIDNLIDEASNNTYWHLKTAPLK